MTRDLLDQLAELAREEQEPARGDRRFERLTYGTIEDDELRALQEADDSDEHRAMLEASRTFGREARERFFVRAKEGLAERGDEAGDQDDLIEGAYEVPKGPVEEREPAKVVELKSRHRQWPRIMVAAGGVLAAAALIALLMRPAEVADLPTYALTVTGGEQAMRSAGNEDGRTEDVVLGPGSEVRIVLRPEVPIDGSVETRTFIADGDAVRPIKLRTITSSEGAVRVDVEGGALVAEAKGATVRVMVAVGRPGHTPETAPALEAGRKSGAFQIFEQRFVIRR